MTLQINIGRFLHIEKRTLAFQLFYVGILIAFLGSLNPWFMWKLSHYYVYIATLFITLAWLLSRSVSKHLFTRTDYKYPLLAFFVILVYQAVVNELNIKGYITIFVNCAIVLSLLSLRYELLTKLAQWLAVTMGCILAVSIPYYMLFLLGYDLPNVSLENEELGYSYFNYFFFLLDNRFTAIIIPRFSSVFLEPGHLGSVCVYLLATQIGRWKKWYCILLMTAIVLSFSLAAYIFMIIMAFMSMWIRGKRIVVSLTIFIALLVTGGVYAYFYNNGNNMVNELILSRLEVDEDGKLVGDNRVTEEFQDEFDDFLESDDILFGRKYENEKYGWGNSGFRVFTYDNGFVGVMLVIVFYLLAIHRSRNLKAKISMFLFACVAFYVRATPMMYYFLIPMYLFAYLDLKQIRRQ